MPFFIKHTINIQGPRPFLSNKNFGNCACSAYFLSVLFLHRMTFLLTNKSVHRAVPHAKVTPFNLPEFIGENCSACPDFLKFKLK